MKKIFIALFIIMFSIFTWRFVSVNATSEVSINDCSFTKVESSLNKDTIKFSYNSKAYSFDLNRFDYYIINDYVVADALENPNCNGFDIIKLIINEDSVKFYFHIDEIQNLFYGIADDVYLNEYNYFKEKSKSKMSLEILNRINSSDSLIISYMQDLDGEQKTYNYNSLEQQNYNRNTTSTCDYTDSLLNELKEMTERDDLVKSYNPNANNEINEYDRKQIDDEIINIIPKELFFKKGIHTYLGKEYGFLLNVTGVFFEKGSQYNTFIIFDVETRTPGSTYMTDYATIYVEPLFQYTFRSVEKKYFTDNETWTNTLGFSNTISQCVRPLPANYGQTYQYSLKNVKFGIDVSNYSELNANDSMYDASKDNGDYITQATYQITNPSFKNTSDHNSLSTALSTVKFLCGFIEKLNIGDCVSTFDFYFSLNNKSPLFEGKSSYNNGVYSLTNGVSNSNLYYMTDAYNQIQNYGNYIRHVDLEPVGQDGSDNDPALLKISNKGRATAMFQFNRANSSNQTGYIESNIMNILCGVSVDIVEDNTYYMMFDWKKKGKLELIGNANGVFELGQYQRVTKEILKFGNNGVSNDVCLEKGQQKCFIYDPDISADIQFYTLGEKDTYLEVWENGKLIAYNDDSGEGLNALINIHVDYGKQYKVFVRFVSSSIEGNFQVKVWYKKPNNVMRNTEVLTLGKDAILYKFVCKETEFYDVEVEGNGLDTMLTIFDENGNVLAENDDNPNIDTLNPFIEIDLDYGQTYYILVQPFEKNNSSDKQINLTIYRSI